MTSNTQPLLVAKFGGSSVADFQSMSNSAQIVLNNPQVRVVVLSASAGVTNLLIELSQGLAPTERETIFNKIKKIQDNILESIPNNSEVKQEIYSLLNSVHTLSEAASLATSPALTDEMVCHGELMSTRLFSAILQSQQAPSKWFDVRDVMITDNHFGRAQPNKEKMLSQCKELLLPLLKEHIIVTQGFIGREDELQRTTTLGRGGSDYTAALLGEALNVSRIDIWTDVPGIYTTDPRVVPSAKKIDEISFEETAEMAIFGAKILHPATLIPAIHAGIPVFVGSSKQPQDGGTIVSGAASTAPSFRAIAIRRNQTLLTLQSLKMLHAHGFLAEVFNILAKHKISVDLITTSEVSVALTLDTTGSSTNGSEVLTKELLNELSRLGRVEVEKNLSLVAIIGNKLDQTPGISKKVFAPLDNISIRMACFGASNHNICLLVANNDANNVTQILHETLFDRA